MMGQRLRGHRKIVSGRHSSLIRHAVAGPQRDLATRIDLALAILAQIVRGMLGSLLGGRKR